MPINRAAVLQQLHQQLQSQLADTAQVSMLRLPASPEVKPQVLLTCHSESIADEQTEPPRFGRKLHLQVQTQATAADDFALLQLLDSLADNIELAFLIDNNIDLWMQITTGASEFNYDVSAPQTSATMVQHFELSYLVLREEVCTAPNVTEVYLSNQGGPHELVAEIPAN